MDLEERRGHREQPGQSRRGVSSAFLEWQRLVAGSLEGEEGTRSPVVFRAG